jgi:hypothetical protein
MCRHNIVHEVGNALGFTQALVEGIGHGEFLSVAWVAGQTGLIRFTEEKVIEAGSCLLGDAAEVLWRLGGDWLLPYDLGCFGIGVAGAADFRGLRA